MNVCVVATASRESGALSVFKQFITALKTEQGDDRYCIFVDPSMPHEEIEGVTYIDYDTCGARRLAFDAFGFRNEVERAGFSPDVIVSFQNVAVAYPKARQIIYFHNLLPLTNIMWNPFLRDERTLFFYSTVYPYYIRMYLKKNMQVVVQTQSVKDMFVAKFRFPRENVHVCRPDIVLPDKDTDISCDFEKGTFNFIYPALLYKYKNHNLLIEAANIIKSRNPEVWRKLRIHLTIAPEESHALIRRIHRNQCSDTFILHGSIVHTQLMAMFAGCSGLLFPSRLETLGIPLLEAASAGLPIIVSDLPYAREAVGGYEGAVFVDCADAELWANEIVKMCNNKQKNKLYKIEGKSSWSKFFGLIHNK